MLVLTTSILVLGNLPSISGEPECAPDMGAIIHECEQYVLKKGPQIPPSQACCASLKGVYLICICKYFTGEIEKIISFDKVLYVANFCHVEIPPPGTKCGGFTVPGKPPPPSKTPTPKM
ncbi:Bifunctional inhibitor/plant lipid transfer protein/seed storage helical domain [Sesbania bispinosa]|nr:Bifunctional inhibitor/plant lipid transfer protein/seed storage helical domain [Sesbania bispinosa]